MGTLYPAAVGGADFRGPAARGMIPARQLQEVSPMTDRELFEAVAAAALLRGDFTLRSGRKSKYYLDKYLFEAEPHILRELGERFSSHRFLRGEVER